MEVHLNIIFLIISIAAVLIGVVFWFARLEFKTNQHGESITTLKLETDTMKNNIVKDIGEVKVSLARIEGSLHVKNAQEGRT